MLVEKQIGGILYLVQLQILQKRTNRLETGPFRARSLRALLFSVCPVSGQLHRIKNNQLIELVQIKL